MSSSEASHNPFIDDVQHDGDICNNCFRRTHWSYERNFVVRTDRDEVWFEEIDGIPDHSYRLNGNTDFIPAEAVTKGTLVVCDCGMPRGAKLRPLTKSQMTSNGARLVERLEELGHDVEEDAFFDTLRELKSDPSNQFKDDEMYAQAVEAALD